MGVMQMLPQDVAFLVCDPLVGKALPLFLKSIVNVLAFFRCWLIKAMKLESSY
jgi:hypothetical protein